MSRQLPLIVDAHKLAKQGATLDGILLLSRLTRVSDLLATDDGEITVHLQFEVGEDHLHYVHGHMTGEIRVLCQRCMEPIVTAVDNKFELGIMDNPEIAKRLPDEIDPVYVDEGELLVFDMIEDELILSLPLIAMHDIKDCSAKEHMQDTGFEKQLKEQEKRDNPFAILKDLK